MITISYLFENVIITKRNGNIIKRSNDNSPTPSQASLLDMTKDIRKKIKASDRMRKLYLKNPDKIKNRNNKYRLANPDKVKLSFKKYYYNNIEKAREDSKKYRSDNIDKRREKELLYAKKRNEPTRTLKSNMKERWSVEEIQHLKQNADKLTDHEIAKNLGRSLKSIKNQRQRMTNIRKLANGTIKPNSERPDE